MQARFQNLGAGLLGLALPLSFLPAAEDAYRLPQLITLCLALLCLGLGWSTRRLLLSPGLGLGLAFFAWRASGGERADWVLEQGLYAALFFWATQHPGLRRRCVAALLCGAGLAAAYGLAQSLGWDPFGAGRQEIGFGARAYSSLGNPNFWGGYLLLLLPLAPWPWMQGFLALSLALTQTRAAWLGAVAAAAVLWRAQPRRLLAGLAAFALLLLAVAPGRLHFREASRPFMARVALDVALAHPLRGAGGGRFTGAYLEAQGRRLEHSPQPYRFTHDAHNDWLQLAAESGFPALLLFGALLALSLRSTWRRDPALAAALAGFAVNALLHFPMAILPSATLLWLVLGWSQEPSRELPSGRWIPNALLVAAASAALLAFSFQLFSSVLLNRGISLPSAPLLRAAARIRPSDERAWMRLGAAADAQGDGMNAELAFRMALEALPQLPEAWANLGLVQGKAGRLEEAKASCLRALALNPKSLEALGNLGKIEYLRGDVAAARAAYARGLALDPSWALGRANLDAINQLERRKKS